MSGPSIHDLLGLPAEITQPNPYQVFGLTLGEADGQVIRTAVEHRVASLKQAKSQTEPEVWSKAARAVQAAQKILHDPEQKAALDATYGIVSDPEPAPAAVIDPLAALLPGSATTPVAASEPQSPAASTSPTIARPAAAQPAIAASQPAGVPAQAGLAEPSLTQPAAAPIPQQVAAAPASPAVAPSIPRGANRRPVKRRRGSGMFFFGSLVLLLLGCFALGTVYFFVKGGIQVVTGPGGIQIKTGTNRTSGSDSPSVSPPRTMSNEPQSDRILKTPPPIRSDAPNAGDEMSMPPERQPPAGANSNLAGGIPEMSTPATDPMPETGMPETGMPETGMPETGMPETGMPDTGIPEPPPPMSPEPTATPQPAPATPPAPKMATPEDLAAGETAILAARTAIVSRKWETMKSLAETAETQAASDGQKQTAETLYQFADLATFYHSAIQKAMSDLVAGNVFKLGENMDFLVQRSSASEIVLYRNKREYPYTLDTLPITVAHALAPFALDAASPEGQAAMAVYQSISSKTTAGHRAESAGILRGLGTVKGVDPKRLAELIESFGS